MPGKLEDPQVSQDWEAEKETRGAFKLPAGATICSNCTHMSFRPDLGSAHLLCSLYRINFVTNGSASFARCSAINKSGDCPDFSPKPSYVVLTTPAPAREGIWLTRLFRYIAGQRT